MKVILSDNAGFCFGVKRAINLAENAKKAGKETKEQVFTFGPIIHNPQVIQKFEKEGVKAVDNIKEVKEGSTILIRTHGVPPEVLNEFSEKNLKVIDATCPFVKKAQEAVKKLAKEGFSIVIIGDSDHPEVKGLVGYSNKKAAVIGTIDEAKKFPKKEKLGVVVQTTQSMDKFKSITGVLSEKAGEIKIINTICSATKHTQDSALKLAGKVDIMIVVGGRNSANTKHLAEICIKTGVPTYHIEDASGLEKDWFSGKKTAGVTAGASTPDWIIDEIVSRLQKI